MLDRAKWLGGLVVASIACTHESLEDAVAHEVAPLGDPLPVAAIVRPPLEEEAQAGYVGVLLPAATLDIEPAEEGRLAEVAVEVGQTLNAGSVVARLDEASIQEALRIARAEMQRAKGGAAERAARARRARDVFEVEQALEREGLATADSVAAAQAQRAETSASVTAATGSVAEVEARIGRLERMLAETELKAPFDGVVAVVYRKSGERVGPAAPVAQLIAANGMTVRFAVPPESASELAVGTKVIARSAGHQVNGIVEQKSPAVDVATGLLFVEARVLGRFDAPPNSVVRVFVQ